MDIGSSWSSIEFYFVAFRRCLYHFSSPPRELNCLLNEIRPALQWKVPFSVIGCLPLVTQVDKCRFVFVTHLIPRTERFMSTRVIKWKASVIRGSSREEYEDCSRAISINNRASVFYDQIYACAWRTIDVNILSFSSLMKKLIEGKQLVFVWASMWIVL